MLIGLVVVALVFGALIGPQFFGAANLELMARQTVIVCVAALGMTMVIVSGGIDLSVGSIVALSTVVTALLLRERRRVPLSAAAGARRRRRAVRRAQRPAHHAAARRAVHRDARDDAARARRREGSRGRAPRRSAHHLAERSAADRAGRTRAGCCPSGIWITVVLAVSWRLHAAVHAVRPAPVRDRIERAHGAAVRRAHQPVQDAPCTRLPAALAALAGVMEFSKLSVGDPTVAVGLELDVIAAVIIGGGSLLGGKGSVVGTIAGAAIMADHPDWLLAAGAAELGAADRDRRDHRVRRRARSLARCDWRGCGWGR